MNTDKNQSFLEQTKLFFDLLTQSTDDYVFIWDIQNQIFKISPSIFEDFPLDRNVEKDVFDLWPAIIHPDDVQRWQQDIQLFLDGKKNYHNLEYRLVGKRGEAVWVSCRGNGHLDERGNPVLMIGGIRNLEKQNKFDNVTGIQGRDQFTGEVARLLQNHTYSHGAVVVIDLDNFKNINEKYGHYFGDKVLREFAMQISQCLPPNVSLYRLDGDEFALFYPLADEEDIRNLYDNIRLTARSSRELDGQKYYCSFSVGVSMYPKDGKNYSDLFRHADSALDMAKLGGKNQIEFFSEEIHEKKLQNLTMVDALRECVENGYNELELYFQPQVDVCSKRLIGAEALLRWHSPIFGEVSPVRFIPLMESSELIVPVGKWIIEQAAQACRDWQKILPDFKISVNVSYIQLKEEGIRQYLSTCFKKYDLKPTSFVLELTENCWIPNLNYVNKNFRELHDMGIDIAIDDFGIGYSSLNYLKELPVNLIKIERSFVQDMQDKSYEYTFVEYIIQLAHILHLKVCVEGVEQESEFRLISRLKPDIIQGFLFGRPVNRETFYRCYLQPGSAGF